MNTPEESPLEKSTRLALEYVADTYKNKKRGVKGTELVTKVLSIFFDILPVASKDQFDPLEWIDLMKSEGKIVEVEYQEASSPYRIKSMYFPPGIKVSEEEVLRMAKMPFDITY